MNELLHPRAVAVPAAWRHRPHRAGALLRYLAVLLPLAFGGALRAQHHVAIPDKAAALELLKWNADVAYAWSFLGGFDVAYMAPEDSAAHEEIALPPKLTLPELQMLLGSEIIVLLRTEPTVDGSDAPLNAVPPAQWTVDSARPACPAAQ